MNWYCLKKKTSIIFHHINKHQQTKKRWHTHFDLHPSWSNPASADLLELHNSSWSSYEQNHWKTVRFLGAGTLLKSTQQSPWQLQLWRIVLRKYDGLKISQDIKSKKMRKDTNQTDAKCLHSLHISGKSTSILPAVQNCFTIYGCNNVRMLLNKAVQLHPVLQFVMRRISPKHLAPF